MPYCTQCGNQVRDIDRWCGSCGTPQASPSPGQESKSQDWLSGINARTAALLCYIPVVGWLGAVMVLASQRFRQDYQTRFHAFQGMYLFVAWLIADWIPKVTLIPGAHWHWAPFGVLKVVVLGMWVLMLIKVSQGENFRLPVIGELAERSVSEQR